MAGEWREVIFSELCNISRGGSPRPIHNWIADEGIPWVKIADATSAGSRYINKTSEFIRTEGRERSVSVFPGDLILTNSATPGIPMFMGIEACIHDGWMLLRNFKGLDRLFTYYLLLHERPALVQQGNGSVFTNLKTDILKNHKVRIPDIPEQRAIAHILGTLDDKIECNRRRNQTLESMARALFQDWFIDFGPVRAKLEGQEPYLPADLWQLFHDRLDDEGKPEGWETKRVSDYLSLAYGKSLPAGKRHQGGVPVYGSGGITGYHKEALVNEPAVIVGRKGTVGSLYWEDRPCFPIDTVFFVQPGAPLPFCYYLLESLPLRDMNTDAAVPGLNRENVYRLELAAPPTTLIAAFTETASCFRESIAAVSGESETLAQLRDTLLPKLISGELRIKDAEKFMERNGI